MEAWCQLFFITGQLVAGLIFVLALLVKKNVQPSFWVSYLIVLGGTLIVGLLINQYQVSVFLAGAMLPGWRALWRRFVATPSRTIFTAAECGVSEKAPEISVAVSSPVIELDEFRSISIAELPVAAG